MVTKIQNWENSQGLQIPKKSSRRPAAPKGERRLRLDELPRRNALNCSPEELIATSWEYEGSGEP